MLSNHQVKQESGRQEEQILADGEVVEHIVEQIEQSEGGTRDEEQTIYLDAEGRGTATAIVDGKEVRILSVLDYRKLDSFLLELRSSF